MAGGQKKKTSKSADYPKTKAAKKRYDAFIREYQLNGNNGTQAAIKAGYKSKNAKQTATKLLTLPYVQEELEKLQEKAVEEYTVTLEKRIKWLEQIVEAGLERHIDSNGNIRPLAMNNSVSAIAEMNKMLGTTTEEDSSNQPIGKVLIEVVPAATVNA